jgi:hypothetical protein
MKFDDDDPLDALVLRTAMSPPSGFAQRVMARVPVGAGVVAGAVAVASASASAGAGVPPDAPSVVTRPSAWARLRKTSATLALAASALAGFSQVLMYVFGMWLATSTG